MSDFQANHSYLFTHRGRKNIATVIPARYFRKMPRPEFRNGCSVWAPAGIVLQLGRLAWHSKILFLFGPSGGWLGLVFDILG